MTQPKPKPAATRGPFKVDQTKERILEWCDHRPDLWETISPGMCQAVLEYEQAKAEYEQAKQAV